MKSPEIPTTVISMYGTFYGCTAIQQMPELPENLQKLCGTFKNCTALNSVTTIPEKVDFMGYYRRRPYWSIPQLF